MTVIVWDGKTLAADKLVLNVNVRTKGTKIRAVGDYLVGYSGSMSVAEEFYAWVEGGFEKGKCPYKHTTGAKSGTAMVIHRNGDIYIYDNSAVGFKVDHHQHAIGCGGQAAMVGLILGHKAADVIEAVTQVDVLCGYGVDTLTFSKTTSRKKP